MEVSRCLVGQTPYITNVKVYDSGQLYDGALMMANASAYSSGAQNAAEVMYYIIAAADGSTAGVDAIGALQTSSKKAYADYMNSTNSGSPQAMNIGSDYAADAASTAGFNYMPVCISTEVMYYAEYFQCADSESGANVINGADLSSSTSTTVTVADLQSETDGGFLFSTDGTDSSAYEPGQLRYITVGASGSCTVDSAMKIDGSDTDLILGLPAGCTRTGMTDDAVGMCSLTDKTADDPSIGLATTLLVFENWVNLGLTGGGLERFRYWSHKGLDGLKGFRAYAEIVLQDHFWGTTPA
ncbi:MAG: hypothetical protein U9N38_00320 [Thermodesulfobacteriota bacterium]|nr:hypothetical protein [Thermodesulfobacteriota bacterium]